jgi:uncharacterized protein YyaL (SSP411 family)
LLRGCWRASYPETTGYTIPTLIECARRLDRPELRDLAIGLADYVSRVRTPEGGVGHWSDSAARITPIVFDTGQVIFGWLAAWRETGVPKYLDDAVKAADWLVSVQSPTGAWYRYQHLGVVKVIDARVAWALLLVAAATGGRVYVDAARKNLDWVYSQQLSNGWFRHAAFSPGRDPFTHTIAYTAEGLLEAGLLLDEPTYVAAAEKVARVLLEKQLPDGSLASTYDEQWRATTRGTCLSGNCQIGTLWMRLFEQSGNQAYLDAARRAVSFVAQTQDLQTSNPCTRGAIAGSLPIYGNYERMKYPNWAAKFFIDALLLLQTLDRTGISQD